MNGIVFVFLYAATAVFVAGHVYYHGVVLKPVIKIFTARERILLALAALAIGVLWVLFLPGLTVVAAKQVGEHLERLPGFERLRHPEHARAGS